MIERPAARYGRQRLSSRSRRRWAIGLFILIIVVGVVVMNLLADIAYAVVNPQIRHDL